MIAHASHLTRHHSTFIVHSAFYPHLQFPSCCSNTISILLIDFQQSTCSPVAQTTAVLPVHSAPPLLCPTLTMNTTRASSGKPKEPPGNHLSFKTRGASVWGILTPPLQSASFQRRPFTAPLATETISLSVPTAILPWRHAQLLSPSPRYYQMLFASCLAMTWGKHPPPLRSLL